MVKNEKMSCYLSEVSMKPVTLVQRAWQTTVGLVSFLHSSTSFTPL